MGCCAPGPALPPDAPEEEKTLSKRESELGYSSHIASKFMEVLLANSEGGRVTANQFTTIASTLNLNITDYDSPDTPMGKFYGRLKEKGKFDAVKLGVVGILLGRGDGKPAQFYDCIARKEERMMGPEDVKLLFEAMTLVSGDVLPMLAKPDDEQAPVAGTTLAPAILTEYVNKIKSGKEVFVEASSNDVMRGRQKVTREDFVGAFQSSEKLAALTTPFAVRKAMKDAAPAPTATPGGASKAVSLFGKGLLGIKK